MAGEAASRANLRGVPDGGGGGRSGGGTRVLGLGIDLVELERVEGALARWGRRMIERLMTPREASRLPAEKAARARAFAEAIAVKEAASKALGTGWTRGVAWRHVELDATAAPRVALHEGAARRAAAMGAREARVVELKVRDGLAIAEVWLVE
jgi:holo-[acyl-carrier protein] synthase